MGFNLSGLNIFRDLCGEVLADAGDFEQLIFRQVFDILGQSLDIERSPPIGPYAERVVILYFEKVCNFSEYLCDFLVFHVGSLTVKAMLFLYPLR